MTTMKKSIYVTIIALMLSITMFSFAACAASSIPKDTQFVYNPEEWEITFEDNFDSEELDRTKWRVGTMIDVDNPENNGVRRAGYYVDDKENLFIKDGFLTIRTNWQENGVYGQGWYTSWVETSTDPNMSNMPVGEDYVGFSQKGGYFEIKCQAPPSVGIWSAFWLMPDEGVAFSKDDIQWSAKDGLEIDIMESPYLYQNKPWCTHVLHCDGYDERLKSSKSKTYKVPNMYSEMHTYALEWTETEYKFYIDGYLTWQTNHEYEGKILNVSEVAEYMILSVEVGGHRDENGNMIPGVDANGAKSWAGNPNDNDKSKNYDFIIDYVKVMQRK